MAIFRVYQGSDDDVSSEQAAGESPAWSPLAPNTVSRTSRPEGNMVKTMSDALAMATGVVSITIPGYVSRSLRDRAGSMS